MTAAARFLFLRLVMVACLPHFAASQDLMTTPARNAAALREYETGNVRTGDLEASREYASRSTLFGHFQDFLQDQGQIWSSPARVRFSDATWLVLIGGLAAGLFVTDRCLLYTSPSPRDCS